MAGSEADGLLQWATVAKIAFLSELICGVGGGGQSKRSKRWPDIADPANERIACRDWHR